jgi:hypothetical protein
MRITRRIITLSVVCGFTLTASSAFGQFGTSQKPFANVRSPSPVSPYLNLFRDDGALSNYFSLVQPQLEQQRFNQNQVRTNQRQQQVAARQQIELQSVAVRVRAQDQQELRPTGRRGSIPLQQRFMNLGSYFGPR